MPDQDRKTLETREGGSTTIEPEKSTGKKPAKQNAEQPAEVNNESDNS